MGYPIDVLLFRWSKRHSHRDLLNREYFVALPILLSL